MDEREPFLIRLDWGRGIVWAPELTEAMRASSRELHHAVQRNDQFNAGLLVGAVLGAVTARADMKGVQWGARTEGASTVFYLEPTDA